MPAVTLTTLRARVRELADMVSSAFVTDAATSLDAFINAGVQSLHDEVLGALGDDGMGTSSSSATLTITSGTGTVSLPSDFYRLLGVDITVSGEVIDARRFEFKERNSLRSNTITRQASVPRYHLDANDTLRFNGANGVYTVVIWYAPAPTALSAGSDTINYPNGWEQYAVLHAAILALAKEESDTGALESLLMRQAQRIQLAASRRHPGAPPKVVDVEAACTDGDAPWEV